jgi:hypothetical protein
MLAQSQDIESLKLSSQSFSRASGPVSLKRTVIRQAGKGPLNPKGWRLQWATSPKWRSLIRRVREFTLERESERKVQFTNQPFVNPFNQPAAPPFAFYSDMDPILVV